MGQRFKETMKMEYFKRESEEKRNQRDTRIEGSIMRATRQLRERGKEYISGRLGKMGGVIRVY